MIKMDEGRKLREIERKIESLGGYIKWGIAIVMVHLTICTLAIVFLLGALLG